jgi:hypothetical protein
MAQVAPIVSKHHYDPAHLEWLCLSANGGLPIVRYQLGRWLCQTKILALFLDHPVIAENRQNFGLFVSTLESQLQPNWR